jgi:hypothetical protein
MSYIDAIHDRDKDRIFVVERQPDFLPTILSIIPTLRVSIAVSMGNHYHVSVHANVVSLKKKNVSTAIRNCMNRISM